MVKVVHPRSQSLETDDQIKKIPTQYSFSLRKDEVP